MPIYAPVPSTATSSPSSRIIADSEEHSNGASQERSTERVTQWEGEEKFTGREYGITAEHSNTDQESDQDSDGDRQREGSAVSISDRDSSSSGEINGSQDRRREGGGGLGGVGEGDMQGGQGGIEGIAGDRDRGKEENRDRGREREGDGKEVPFRAVLTVKSVDCGDFHTAALTHSSRIFVWGGCSVNAPASSTDPLSSSSSSSSSASATSSSSSFSSSSATPDSITHDTKVDVTSHLKGVPKQVLTLSLSSYVTIFIVIMSTD